MTRVRIVLAAALVGGTVLVPSATPTAAQAPLPTVAIEPVVTGLSAPVFVTHDGTGNGVLYIAEQGGVIKTLAPGETTPTVWADISTHVLAGGERGLLGVAIDPIPEVEKHFYATYTRQPDGAVVVSEIIPSPAGFGETPMLTIPHPEGNHNGGMTALGPDGFLYVSMGDGGGANDPGNRAQNLGDLAGKVLRIDPSASTGGLTYGIPADNPFVGVEGARPEIWATGFRNPWRFSFDSATGDLWLGDVGQGAREEIDVVEAGGNYGWRVFEGTRCTGLGPAACDPTQYEPPVAEYDSTAGPRCSVTGGYVYRGDAGVVPDGGYVFGDFCTGEIFLHQPGQPLHVLADTNLNISSFGETADGELLVVDLNGGVYRIVEGVTIPPGPAPCAPPTGLVSGVLYAVGVALGPLGAAVRDLAVGLCRIGL